MPTQPRSRTTMLVVFALFLPFESVARSADGFTFEFRVRGEPDGTPVTCGDGDGWRDGAVAFDRGFGVSFAAGRVAFGVDVGEAGAWTLCGDTVVLDGDWHHVAVQRRADDGALWIWVDGELDARWRGPAGPQGDVEEKFETDRGSAFTGLVDGVRRYRGVRYAAAFEPPSGRVESEWLPALPAGATLEVFPAEGPGPTILFVRLTEPVAGPVSVTIRDDTGRVRVGLEGAMDRGSAMLVWDGKANDGSSCEPGRYVATWEGGGAVLSARFDIR